MKKSRRLSVSGLAVALTVMVLALARLLPSMRIGLAALLGLPVAAVVIEAGVAAGVLCYFAAAVLGLLLAPSATAVLYAAFFGFYPAVKYAAERIRHPAGVWAVKLGVCNACLCLLYVAAERVFFADWQGLLNIASMPSWMAGSLWIFWAAANAAFVLYDIGLSGLIVFYTRRIRPRF